MELFEAIRSRRSCRAYSGEPATKEELNLLAVTVGQALTSRLDPSWVHLAAGALFIFFGVNSIRSCSEKEDSDGDEKLSKRGPFATSFLMIFFAEMGDKTQLMTAALAARHRDFVSVFAGSTAALCLVSRSWSPRPRWPA